MSIVNTSAPPIIFPKALPGYITETESDETGFTQIEKVTLQNAWRVVKRFSRRYSKDIFLNFFVANELLLERFRGQNGTILMENLHMHPLQVLKVYERLIEEGLDNAGSLNIIMTEISNRHREHRVSMEEISMMTTAVKLYLQGVLEKISSPTLVLALDKVCDMINEYHSEERDQPVVLKEKDEE